MLGVYLATVPPTVGIWSSLFNLYNVFGAIAAILVISYLVYNVVKYRRREGHDEAVEERGEEKVNWRKVLFTLAITSSVLFVVELQTFNSVPLIVPPQSSDPLNIGVVGHQWSWTFVYPNGDRLVGNLTVPAGRVVILNITSTDVTHSFAITGLDVAVDANAGRYNSLWFTAPDAGSTYTIRCKELCGVGHAFMTAKMTVVDQATFNAWIQSTGGKPGS
ncbi:MAG: cytochrome c oxidase subunit II [Thaumarchaeota archaeon]|nr:cytochrome c oxidase subunit II [Nitrososphaerota archaeon]